MDKAERARLLRLRFKAKGGVPFVFTGVRKPKPEPRPKLTKLYVAWPEANRDTRRAGVWMHQADSKPQIVPRPKRRRGVPVLTRIAKQEPKKLVRAYRDAEAFAASRKPQSRP